MRRFLLLFSLTGKVTFESFGLVLDGCHLVQELDLSRIGQLLKRKIYNLLSLNNFQRRNRLIANLNVVEGENYLSGLIKNYFLASLSL